MLILCLSYLFLSHFLNSSNLRLIFHQILHHIFKLYFWSLLYCYNAISHYKFIVIVSIKRKTSQKESQEEEEEEKQRKWKWQKKWEIERQWEWVTERGQSDLIWPYTPSPPPLRSPCRGEETILTSVLVLNGLYSLLTSFFG